MPEIHITLDQLRQMIGVRVTFLGDRWMVIEVLEDGPALVLENLTTTQTLQHDQFGEATRRTPQRLSVPVLTADRRNLHPEFLDLDLVGDGE